MKEEILRLKSEGKTYRQIQEILGCSKGTISYHCGPNQKAKALERQRDNRAKDVNRKIKTRCGFFSSRNSKKLRVASCNFTRGSKRDITPDQLFSYGDVIEKFGVETICYLTGQKINLFSDDYHFDHIIPVSKGGINSLNNLGICTPAANLAKSNLSVDEFVDLCKQVIKHKESNL